MKILFISNHEVTLYYFRTELLKNLVDDGNEVLISQPYGEHREFFESIGCKCIDTSITQYGMNPLKELSLVKHYKRLIKEHSPDVVATYTIKPNLYGGIAACSCKVPYISTITGLGGAFEKGNLFKRLMIFLYKRATKRISALFFQNRTASDLFDSFGIAKGKHIIVSGSGVNLEKHRVLPYPEDDGTTRLLYIGRLMNDKGVRELFEAVRKLKSRGLEVSLDCVGWCEEECKELLEKYVSEGTVNYHGWQEDVSPFIEKCHAVILPSYHEGLANALLEAAASGRPVLASNIHGCIETFDDGVTGFGFEPRSTEAVESAIEAFTRLSHSDRAATGKRAREKMEKEFDRNTVVEKYKEVIYKTGGRNNESL